jgi:hypothetical protein
LRKLQGSSRSTFSTETQARAPAVDLGRDRRQPIADRRDGPVGRHGGHARIRARDDGVGRPVAHADGVLAHLDQEALPRLGSVEPRRAPKQHRLSRRGGCCEKEREHDKSELSQHQNSSPIGSTP